MGQREEDEVSEQEALEQRKAYRENPLMHAHMLFQRFCVETGSFESIKDYVLNDPPSSQSVRHLVILQRQCHLRFFRAYDVFRIQQSLSCDAETEGDSGSGEGEVSAVASEPGYDSRLKIARLLEEGAEAGEVVSTSRAARVLLEGSIGGSDSALTWKIVNFDLGVCRFSSLGPGLDELSAEIGLSDYTSVYPDDYFNGFLHTNQ